jgi:hypothetical protein
VYVAGQAGALLQEGGEARLINRTGQNCQNCLWQGIFFSPSTGNMASNEPSNLLYYDFFFSLLITWLKVGGTDPVMGRLSKREIEIDFLSYYDLSDPV